MARRKTRRKYKKPGKVAVRYHIRTPRGPNRGKKNVKVRFYTRDSGWAKRRRK